MSPLPPALPYLTFRVARTLYAIPAAMLDFVALPPLGGGTVLRGEYVPRLDLREWLGLPRRERGAEEFLVVVSPEGAEKVALVVDTIEGLSDAAGIGAEKAEVLDVAGLAAPALA